MIVWLAFCLFVWLTVSVVITLYYLLSFQRCNNGKMTSLSVYISTEIREQLSLTFNFWVKINTTTSCNIVETLLKNANFCHKIHPSGQKI